MSLLGLSKKILELVIYFDVIVSTIQTKDQRCVYWFLLTCVQNRAHCLWVIFARLPWAWLMFWLVLWRVAARRIRSLHWSLLFCNIYGLMKRGTTVINLLMQATRFSWLGTAINWNRRCNSWITRFTVDRCSWICSNSIVWDSYLSCCFGGSNRATVCLRLTILNWLVLFLQLLFGANSSTFGSALSRISNSCHRCIHMCEHTLIQFRSLWAYCQTCVRSVNHDLVAFSR